MFLKCTSFSQVCGFKTIVKQV